MADQVKKTILAALVNQIDAQATTIAFVDYKPEFDPNQNMPPGKLPACIITVGPSRTGHSITSTTEYYFQVLIQVISEPNYGDDLLFDLEEEVKDAVDYDIQLGATCISCLSTQDQQPTVFTSEICKMVHLQYEIRYWRDFP